MCGISGFNWKDEEKIKTMMSSLSHRGPDADGLFTEEGISLGHNRLAIIDLSNEANQPMVDERNSLIIVYNGEIYNFREIKKELENEYKFKTKSDTEVILAGYRKWGKDVVKKLDGMFAFAIWDREKKELFLARDHAGIKPLYYFFDPSNSSGKKSRFIFASEIKAILNHDITRKLDNTAFNNYFRILYTPDSLTMVENIYKLPPAHTMYLKEGNISIEPYEKPPSKLNTLSFEEASSTLREKVISSVESHLISDVPLGVYLSGGIDSSTVLFAMSQFHKDIKTFSVGFSLDNKDEEEKFNHDFNLAKKTSEFFNSDHHSLTVSSQDVLDSFEEVSIHNDDPISNPTSIIMFILSKFARKDVKVVLTGSGGDELFGGYDRYRIALAASYYKKLPSVFREIFNLNKKISKLEYEKESDLFARVMFEKDNRLERVISPEFLSEGSVIKDFFQDKYFKECEGSLPECFMKIDQKSWLPDHFFSMSDKMSMANALEERVPLISKDLKDFSDSLPWSYKSNLKTSKKILKNAFKNDLPDFLFNQPKRGWFSPAAKWFREPEFSDFARSVLSEDYYNETKNIFDWAGLQDMLEKHINKEGYNLTILWAVLTFQVWARQYKIKI